MSTTAGALYTAAWALLCLVAVVVAWRSPREEGPFSMGYRRLLTTPWRLATGAVATVFLVGAAPYANDPTWDHAVGLFMSVFTYATAPWAVGAVLRSLRGELPRRQLFVAACAWMFSASWSYDAYNFARSGVYPPSWAANIVASSVLYVSAGLCWSLVHRPGTGVTFGFLHPGWPSAPAGGDDRRVAAMALVFVFFVAALLLPFVAGIVPWLPRW
ncbi:MAG: hypothetical protein EPO40_31335 [Myxococcaceae bacterium]|nr:MAG: hypothetical protein EPO40_31335 [Myxococcaceae bacterium]